MNKKIYIIGPVGSGKTTLSRKLSLKYNIKCYELDKIVWDDVNHVKRTSEEINRLFQNIINRKAWIIEDVGREKFTEGIKKADITYYIDLPKNTIYLRCFTRWLKQVFRIEKYNYKPSFKTLLEMINWAKKDINNKGDKLDFIIKNSKKYKVLKKKDINGWIR